MTTKITVYSENMNPIFGEGAIRIGLDDESSGLFLTMKQNTSDGEAKVCITFEEWTEVVAAVADIMGQEGVK